MDLTELFCEVDDFYRDYLQTFANTFLPTLNPKLPQYCRLAPSEVMTIVIHFHQSSYRNFKHYYIKYVSQYLADYFPHLLSYNRMVEVMPNVLTACLYYLKSLQGTPTGIVL